MRLLFFILMVTFFAGCEKDEDSLAEYTYGGTVNVGGSNTTLKGTTWVLYQYKDATTTVPQSRSDTLRFYAETDYIYSGDSAKYNLYATGGMYTLSLYSTVFGDLQGNVPNTFITQGEIVNASFHITSIGGGNAEYFIWMKKL